MLRKTNEQTSRANKQRGKEAKRQTRKDTRIRNKQKAMSTQPRCCLQFGNAHVRNQQASKQALAKETSKQNINETSKREENHGVTIEHSHSQTHDAQSRTNTSNQQQKTKTTNQQNAAIDKQPNTR